MRVLITGAAGFAGRHLAERFAAEGLEVVGAGRRSAEETDPPAALSRYVAADLADPPTSTTWDRGRCRSPISSRGWRRSPSSSAPIRTCSAPNDLVDMRASTEKLTAATGWEPRIPLADTLDWWRAEVAR